MGMVDESSYCGDGVEDDEGDDQRVDPRAHLVMELCFGLHEQIDGTVDGEEGDCHSADEQGIRMDEVIEIARITVVLVHGQAMDQVADDKAKSQSNH